MADPLSDTLGGMLSVTTGRPRPFNLTSTRPDWAHQLVQGKPVSNVPGLLASLFNLCGQAHRLCAGLAIQAARGEPSSFSEEGRRLLQTETLREHLRRITLDWPLQLAASAESRARFQDAAHKALRAFPPGTGLPAAPDALADWLSEHLLGGPPGEWLAHWEQAPHAWMRRWCASTPAWLPELLEGAKGVADTPMPAPHVLRVHACPRELRLLAHQLRSSPAFNRQPHWQGQCAETGPWGRLNQPAPEQLGTPWLRLGARLAELVRLSLPDAPQRSGRHWLQAGSVCLGPGEGLGWVEMARGLLVHFIRLDGSGAEARAQACRVLAPTEWNFHPQGAVAQVLETLPATLTAPLEHRIRALMTAFDPCMRFELLAAHGALEKTHA